MLSRNKTPFLILLFLLMVLFLPELNAQCPMCRMSAESNMANGGTAGRGLNSGILYMLAMPYFIIGTVAFIWYRNRKKNKEETSEENPSDNRLSDQTLV